MSELLRLAERCEQTAEPGLSIDDTLYNAFVVVRSENGRVWHEINGRPRPAGGSAPRYTSSLDCALQLVPPGWHVGMLTECDEDDLPAACLTENEEPCRDAVGKGANMTLSLCAAALRARAVTKGEGDKTSNTGEIEP